MEFDYRNYLTDSLIALCLSVMMIVAIIASLKHYLKLFAGKKQGRKDLFDFICILTICGILLSINISKLVHGGAILLFENEEDKRQICGQIEQIEDLGYWGIPKLSVDGGSGTQLTINGVQYRTIHDVDFNVGDYVMVEYLPKSGYVLYIDEIITQ